MRARPPAYPAGDASVTGLCDGVISTAERLRAAARQAAVRPAWSPVLTRESLRQTAGCCAITASNLRVVLRTLAEHQGRPGAPLSTSMADAAAAADGARATWLQAAEAWDDITTDTRAPPAGLPPKQPTSRYGLAGSRTPALTGHPPWDRATRPVRPLNWPPARISCVMSSTLSTTPAIPWPRSLRLTAARQGQRP